MTLRYLRRLRSVVTGETGATAVEYGLMVALIALAIFGGVYLLGPALDAIFDEAAASL
ncbi:Flp family type IVb pilin [Oryzobacter sp. R7]|uniref:Flp family type IVb pilin n=1 Tax=Oryzobacter faecalis TaxID=3388656 RepID=UPI00398D2A4D